MRNLVPDSTDKPLVVARNRRSIRQDVRLEHLFVLNLSRQICINTVNSLLLIYTNLRRRKHFLLVEIEDAVQVLTECCGECCLPNVHPNPPQPSPSHPREHRFFWDFIFGHIKTLPPPPPLQDSDVLMENLNNLFDFRFGHIKYHPLLPE